MYVILFSTIFRFKTQSRLTRTSPNSNYFQFLLTVRIKRLQLYRSFTMETAVLAKAETSPTLNSSSALYTATGQNSSQTLSKQVKLPVSHSILPKPMQSYLAECRELSQSIGTKIT